MPTRFVGTFLFAVCAVVLSGVGAAWAETAGAAEQPARIASKAYVDIEISSLDTRVTDEVTTLNESISTKAAVDDTRFNTVATAEPTGTSPDGQAFIWCN